MRGPARKGDNSGVPPFGVLIDGRPLAGTTGLRGVGRYVRELLRGLAALPDGPRVAALVDAGRPPEALPDGTATVPAWHPPGPALAWGRVLGPRWIRASGAAVWHATFLAPPRVPRGFPWVATIHDLIPLRHPDRFGWKQRQVFARSLRLGAAAPRVIAVSRFTADLVRRHFGTPAARLEVVPPPIDTGAYAAVGHPGLPGLDRPYLLHLGGFDPLKGVADRLLPAFAALAAGRRDLVLVLTGAGPGRAAAERLVADAGLAGQVRFVGHLDDPGHRAAIAGAAAVVVPSVEEGFGMPVAEALAAGVPVAIGPAEASREAAGALGHAAADGTPGAFARAIEEALAAGGPRSAEGAARRAYARRFDRAEVARAVAAIYGALAGGA